MELRQVYERNYKNGRSNLLMMTVLTVVNVILLLLNATVSFPFSAFFPQFVFALLAYSGAEYDLFYIVGIILAVVPLGIYLLCYFLSAKRISWLVTALVLFSLDFIFLIIFLLPQIEASSIIDIVFHIWVIYYLIRGVSSGFKLKNLGDIKEEV